MVNLVAHLGDPRFEPRDVHHAIEAFDRDGVTIEREFRAPERLLAWIDEQFGGAWSSEVAQSSVWYARAGDEFLGFAAYDSRTYAYRWLRPWANVDDAGIFGPIGAAPARRRSGLGTTLLRAALFGLRERGFRRALIPAVGPPELIRWYEREAGAQRADVFALGDAPRIRTTILASGEGSNFAAVAEAAAAGDLPLDIAALVCDRPRARVLERATEAGIAARPVVWDRTAEDRAAFDSRVLVEVMRTEPALVLMLGWMHVLPRLFVEQFACLNVHPAFLPLDPSAETVTFPDGSVGPVFRGARAVDDAVAADAGWVGASFHRVGAEVDRGEILARAPLRRPAGEARPALDDRLHALERRVVAAGIRRWSWEQPS